ncbi:MAG: hypothetical protein FPO08_18755 [Geobacter sp.]|nr:MAG: hypothetical protein FPO08_18755 [Geobacter sp.]
MNIAKEFMNTVGMSLQQLRDVEEWRSGAVSFLPRLPLGIRAALEEAARKEQLLAQGQYYPLALRQAKRRQAAAAYAALAYAVDGREAA